MQPDREWLNALSSFDDDRLGIREQFLTPSIGGARTVAVVSTPLEGTPAMGWLILGSLAADHANIEPFEVALARRLAREGSAVLRFHGQGYGDSELEAMAISLGSHRRDALDAASVLRAATGIERIGLIGARFGGSIGAIVAPEVAADALVLVDPITRGRPYVRALIQRELPAAVPGEWGRRMRERPERIHGRERSLGAEQARSPEPPRGLQPGMIGATRIDPAAAQEIADLDLLDALGGKPSFAGRSLVLQVSMGSEPRPDLVSLRDRLGGPVRSSLQVVDRLDALRFGLPRFRANAEPGSGPKMDVQASLVEALVEAVVAWCRGTSVWVTAGDVRAVPVQPALTRTEPVGAEA